MRHKKAQFYIVAAVIIAIMLLGLFATKNYIRVKPKDVKFYDLSKELNLESGYVIDYGVYRDDKEVDTLIEDWLTKYVAYSRTVTGVGDWIFVYGNENKVTALFFSGTPTGQVGMYIGGEFVGNILPGTKTDKTYVEAGQNVTIVAPDGYKYDFTLNPGENFFFVISKEGYVSVPGTGGL